MDSMTALAIAVAMKGEWQRKPGERDTEKVKRIWKIMADAKAEMAAASDYGTNTGHGHVWKRPDGVRMRCGGPGMCVQCSRDAVSAEMSMEAPND